MKIELNLHERLIFLSLLPTENNFSTLRIIRQVKKDVGLTDEEFIWYEVKQSEDAPGIINFNPKKAQEVKEFEIGEVAFQIIKTALDKLDAEKKLKQEHISVYEKIFQVISS